MKITLRNIPETGAVFEWPMAGETLRQWLADHPEILSVESGGARVECSRIGQLVTVRGQARISLTFICSRCAEETKTDWTVPIKMVLAPHNMRTATTTEVEDENTGFHNGREIGLDAIVLEQVALATPMILLCKPDCRGLCPACNANLNNGPCPCGAR